MGVMDHLLKAVRDASIFNPEIQVAPACILWPDSDRQWEVVIPALQAKLHELLILGDYAPDKRMGSFGFVVQSQGRTMMLPFQKASRSSYFCQVSADRICERLRIAWTT
jgi:hypothetical protein